MTNSTSTQANQKRKQTALKGISKLNYLLEEQPAAKVNPLAVKASPIKTDKASPNSKTQPLIATSRADKTRSSSPVKPVLVEITPLPEGVANLWEKALTRDMNEAKGKSRFADPELRRYLDQMNKLSAGKDHQVRPEWTPKALKSA